MSLFFASMPIVAVHVFYCFLQRFLLKWRKISQELGGGVDFPPEPLLNPPVQEV